MKKKELIKKIADKTDRNEVIADAYIQIISDIIVESLMNGDKVTLPGLGTFVMRERTARLGVNPKTLEKINISESKRIAFKQSKSLKDKLNGKK